MSGIADVLNEFDVRLKVVEDALKPFLDKSFDETLAELDDAEIAKLNIVLSYAMNSLFFVFLKTQGVSTVNHPVKKELQRVQGYFEKLKQAQQKKSDLEVQASANAEAAQKLLQDAVEGANAGVDNEEEEEEEEAPKSDKSKKKDKKDKKRSKSEKKEKGSSSKKSKKH